MSGGRDGRKGSCYKTKEVSNKHETEKSVYSEFTD